MQGQAGFFIEEWRVSPAEGVLSQGSEVTRLEPKAMDVLVYLAERPNQVVTREELERDVWHGALVGYDAVTNTVIKLRKALQDDARQPRFIATIPKKGYQLIAQVTWPDDAPPEAAPAAPPAPAAATAPRARLVIAVLAVIGLIEAGYWLWPSPDTPDKPDKTAAMTHGMNDGTTPPSIVVLPFDTLDNDTKQENLASGITEDIITDLSRLSNLMVIASNTSSAYKGREDALERIGQDLGVQFALKGNIRQIGENVRVNVQLVNTKTGFNVWAQRYDRKLAELFSVQDEVSQQIVTALAIKTTSQEEQRLAQRATSNLRAYDYFLEGQRLFKITTKEANEHAREMYRRAINLDPSYGRAFGALAVTLVIDFRNGWATNPVETMDRALELARTAVNVDDSTPQTHWALGFVHLWRKEYDKAEKATADSIRIAPNYADGYGLLALINAFLGNADKAMELNKTAIRHNPYFSFEYFIVPGIANYMLGNYDAAIETLEKAHARNSNAVNVKTLLAACYVRANRLEDAEWIVTELQIISPESTISNLEYTMPVAKPEFMQALAEDLRKAGLPE